MTTPSNTQAATMERVRRLLVTARGVGPLDQNSINLALRELDAALADQPNPEPVAQAEPVNPYGAGGSMSEAWRRGFNGENCIAHPGSDYDRAWREGLVARKAAAPSPVALQGRDDESRRDTRQRLWDIGRQLDCDELDSNQLSAIGNELMVLSNVCGACRGEGIDGDPPDCNGDGGWTGKCAKCNGTGRTGAARASLPAQQATAAGLEAANGHLTTLLNECTPMLAELRALVDSMHDQWCNGGRPERGEVPLLDRVDDWLAGRPPEMLEASLPAGGVVPDTVQLHGLSDWLRKKAVDSSTPDSEYTPLIQWAAQVDDARLALGSVPESVRGILSEAYSERNDGERALRQWSLAIARRAAWAHGQFAGSPSYLPKDSQATKSFEPHAWVLHAISDAVQRTLMAPPVPAVTPQPSETQGRRQLTDEQIRLMCKQSWVFETVKQWVRITEAHHGIPASPQDGGGQA